MGIEVKLALRVAETDPPNSDKDIYAIMKRPLNIRLEVFRILGGIISSIYLTITDSVC